LIIGYSTFVAVPTDPDHPLPQTDADVIAASLSQSASSGPRYSSTSRSPSSATGLEDEDLLFQAALQASLDGGLPGAPSFPIPPIHPGLFASGPSVRPPSATTSVPSFRQPTSPPPPVPPPGTRPADQPMTNPVAASMARNQAMLERMRREQEVALREHYNEEVSRFDGQTDRPYEVGSPVEDEEEQLRRAIEASKEMAREQGQLEGGAGSDGAETTLRTENNNNQAEAWTRERVQGGRVYDDEDKELQAALQASLESAQPGIHIPNSDTMPPRPRRSPPPAASTSGPHGRSLTGTGEHEEADDEMYDDDDDDDEGEDETATEETLSDTADSHSEPAPQAESVDLEEMRRRRLARFGG